MGPTTLFHSEHLLTLGGTEVDGPGGIVVRDGIIIDILAGEELAQGVASCDRSVGFGRRTLMPGFVDPHAHAEVASKAAYQMVDVRAPACPDIPTVLGTLRQELPRAREGWLIAQGNLFFDQKLREQRFPTRQELDTVSTDCAIIIRAGGHLSILNSRALELAGIDDSYESVDYSVTGKPTVQRDENGRPTGIVKEMDKLLPLPELTRAEARIALETGIRDLFTAYGVTTIGEISETLDCGLNLYDEAICDGRIRARLHVYLWTPGTVTIDEACNADLWADLKAPQGMLRIQGVKAFADGGFSAARAALTHPYAAGGGHNCGELALSAEAIVELARKTADAGIQLAVHANGDLAQLHVCEALESAAIRSEPRVRIEHAGNLVPDYGRLSEAWRRADVIPVPQPVFIQNFAEFLPTYVGDYAKTKQFPLRTMLDDGWPISGSSDVWVGSEIGQTNPFLSIACCTSRRTFHGDSLDDGQELTILEALRMHTLGGATALGVQDSRGSLEVEKLADFIVLDRNPLDGDLLQIVVDEVYLGGELAFVAPGAPHA